MSDVQYDNKWVPPNTASRRKPDLSDRLIKWGIVSTQEQATKVLVGTVVVALLIALFFSWSFIFGTPASSAPELPIPTHSR